MCFELLIRIDDARGFTHPPFQQAEQRNGTHKERSMRISIQLEIQPDEVALATELLSTLRRALFLVNTAMQIDCLSWAFHIASRAQAAHRAR